MKAGKIGLREKKYPVWSKQEETLLKKLYPDNNLRDIANELGRTVSAVQNKTGKLGIRKSIRVWSKKDMNLLKKLYPSKTAQQIADQIGRTVLATRFGIVKLGLRKRRSTAKNWERMAKKYYNYEETHRTVKGVKQKRCIKCKKWKDESKSEFRKDRVRKDGLVNRCKACDKAYYRKHRKKNRKAVREYLRYEDRHRVVRGVKEKLCSRCKQWKYKSQFNRNRRSKDGLGLQCKECGRKRYERITKAGRRNFPYEKRHRIVNGVKEKLCRKCKKWKDESEYFRNRSCKDGLTEWCKNCQLASARKRYKKAGKGLKKYYRYEECHRVVDGVKQKRCRKCKRWKAENEFYRNRSEKDGLTGRCKKCSYKATSKSRKKQHLAV